MIEFGIAVGITVFTYLVYKMGYGAGWDAAMVRSCQIMQKHGDTHPTDRPGE